MDVATLGVACDGDLDHGSGRLGFLPVQDQGFFDMGEEFTGDLFDLVPFVALQVRFGPG